MKVEVRDLVDWILPLLEDRSIEVQGAVLGALFAKLLVDHPTIKERTEIMLSYAAALQGGRAFEDKVQ